MVDDVFIVGDGGHARSLFNVMKRLDKLPKAFLTINNRNNFQYEIPVINEEEFLNSARNENVHLINGVGSVGNLDKRKWIYKSKRYFGLQFKSVIDPSAVIFDQVNINNGAQIMAGVVLCNNVTVGENTIINTGVTIDHDCLIGRHCHIAPGATLSGGVIVGDETHIGAGATVIQNVILGKRCLVAAGAVVTSNFGDDCKVFGVPAHRKI